jgi:hypothetical protein
MPDGSVWPTAHELRGDQGARTRTTQDDDR